MDRYDSIVVGGGVNSLVTASILGQSGKKVLLLEARNQIGGLASTTEFSPGYKCNLVNDVVKWLGVFGMLAGRLEIFTLLILLIPAYWRH